MKRAAVVLFALSLAVTLSCGYKSSSYYKPPSKLSTRVLASQDINSSFTLGGLKIINAGNDTVPAVREISAGNTPGLPYQYVGQIRSEAGLSSGFVVRSRVVATAAHVVWDDGTLSATTGVEWLLRSQRDDGTWHEDPFTGTGFPKVFYLKYHYYALYFPLMAIGRYLVSTHPAPEPVVGYQTDE